MSANSLSFSKLCPLDTEAEAKRRAPLFIIIIRTYVKRILNSPKVVHLVEILSFTFLFQKVIWMVGI